MEQDQGWRWFLNLLLEVRSACGAIGKQVNTLHWKRTSYLLRFSEGSRCYVTLFKRGQEVIHEKDCVRKSCYETAHLTVLTFWDQAHKRPLNYFGKFSIQLQEYFIVQFISILFVINPLERPTKTSFQETLFIFGLLWLSSIVILLHHMGFFLSIFLLKKRSIFFLPAWCPSLSSRAPSD